MLAIISSLISLLPLSYSSSGWTPGQDMPSKRTELSAVSLADDIYVIGGQSKKGATDLVEVYNPKTDKWSQAAPLPEKRDHVAAATYNNRIYVLGGFNDTGMPTDNMFIYDTITEKWEQGANIPTPRGALTAQFVNGILYAIGGDGTRIYGPDGRYDPQGVVATNEAYDPKTDTWSTMSPMQIPRDHLASAAIDGKIYVIAGREPIGKSSFFRNLDVNEMYDPEADTWIFRHDLPSFRSGLAATLVDEKIYTFGGESTESTFNNNEQYNSKTDSWKSCPPMPTARHGLGSVPIDGKIYVIGGNLKPAGSGDNKNEIFDGIC